MPKVTALFLILMLLPSDAMSGEEEVYAEKDALLVTGRVTEMDRRPTDISSMPYRMAFESKPIARSGMEDVRVRVWDRTWKSWPGSQPQIIQIVDASNRVLSVKEVGGEPMMKEAWIAQCHGPRLFVYIKCDHRRGDPPGTYIYEIGKDNSVAEKGIYFSIDDLAANEKQRETISRPLWERSHSTGDSR